MAHLIRNSRTGVVCGVTAEMLDHYLKQDEFELHTIPVPVAAPPPPPPGKRKSSGKKTKPE